MDQASFIPPGGRPLDPVERAALMAELEEIVRSSHLFKSLESDGRERLVNSGYVVTFEPGEVLIRQGDEGLTMYLVMQGRVRVETQGARGSVQLAELGRGACLGEVAVLTGGPRTATVTAIEPLQVIVFEKHRIERIIGDNPRVKRLLTTLIEGRARDAVEKIIAS